jgi:hypothetical protein
MTARAAERWRKGVLALALTLPFAATALAGRSIVTRLAGLSAAPLYRAAGRLADALPEPRVVVPLPPTPEAAAIAAIEGDDATVAPATSAEAPQPTITQSGIGVSRARVMAAVKAGIRPSGSGVSATSWRPAGLAVHGISAVGVGLRDGDVLTKVGGTAATSPGAVISAVRAALRRKQPAIVGEVWRGHHRFLVSVELPRVRFRDEESVGEGSGEPGDAGSDPAPPTRPAARPAAR